MPSSWLENIFKKSEDLAPSKAYDLWAGHYDLQPGNLMLDLDEILVRDLLKEISFANKIVADIGCGTGRHWNKIYGQQPARLIGFEVSKKMLEKLIEKFPSAETHLTRDSGLMEIENNSVDIIISTLTIAHIEKFEKAFLEWTRVLKPGGEIILTDYHPEALAKGAKRTFQHDGKTVVIKNHIHSVNKIRLLARQLGYSEIRFTEKNIDESVRSYYEQQNAMELYERFRGTPIIYGIHLKKTDDPS